jgi:hypothetical protein
LQNLSEIFFRLCGFRPVAGFGPIAETFSFARTQVIDNLGVVRNIGKQFEAVRGRTHVLVVRDGNRPVRHFSIVISGFCAKDVAGVISPPEESGMKQGRTLQECKRV